MEVYKPLVIKMVNPAFLILALLTVGFIFTVLVAIREITNVTEREIKLMERLGWLLCIPKDEQKELEFFYLMLKRREIQWSTEIKKTLEELEVLGL